MLSELVQTNRTVTIRSVVRAILYCFISLLYFLLVKGIVYSWNI